MTEYVWYDPEFDEIFVNFLCEDLELCGETLAPSICLGEL